MQTPRTQDTQSTASTMAEVQNSLERKLGWEASETSQSSQQELPEEEQERKRTKLSTSIIAWFTSSTGRVCCAMLTSHVVMFLIFTAAVLLAIRWNDIVAVDNDVLIDSRDGQPLKVQQLIQSAQANLLALPQVASAVRVVSVIVTIPTARLSSISSSSKTGENNSEILATNNEEKKGGEGAPSDDGDLANNNKEEKKGGEGAASDDGDDIVQRMYNVEGLEIHEGTNTTILWLSMGHSMTITPKVVTLHDRDTESVIYSWDMLENLSNSEMDSSKARTSEEENSNEAAPHNFFSQNFVKAETTDRKLQFLPFSPMPYMNYYPYINYYPYWRPSPYTALPVFYPPIGGKKFGRW